jgi:eukaryotic-like serine/threonine-protein kinase
MKSIFRRNILYFLTLWLAIVVIILFFFFRNSFVKTSFKKSVCPADMVFIEGGSLDTNWVSLGTLIPAYRPASKGSPGTVVRRIFPFCMDQYEYPNIKNRIPRSSVSFTEAKVSCESQNKRLCTEDEWELACAGTKWRLYSYGNEKENKRCNTDGIQAGDFSKLAPSGSFPKCRNQNGVYDLNGNLSEIVLTENMVDEGFFILRGDTMWDSNYGQSCYSRHAHSVSENAYDDDGFRCCADLNGKKSSTP